MYLAYNFYMDEEKEKEIQVSWENKFMKPLKKRRVIIVDNFLGGLAWSLGTFVGLGIIATILGYIFRRADFAAVFANWLAQIIKEALQQLPPAR